MRIRLNSCQDNMKISLERIVIGIMNYQKQQESRKIVNLIYYYESINIIFCIIIFILLIV